MVKVYFENDVCEYMTEKQYDLHRKMQREFNELNSMRKNKENELKSKMEGSAINIAKECLEEMKMFFKTLEPALDVCMRYEITSSFPQLNVKIHMVELC